MEEQIKFDLPTETELLRASERFQAHMQFLSNVGEIKMSESRSNTDHLEGALLEVLIGFLEDRELQ